MFFRDKCSAVPTKSKGSFAVIREILFSFERRDIRTGGRQADVGQKLTCRRTSSMHGLMLQLICQISVSVATLEESGR